MSKEQPEEKYELPAETAKSFGLAPGAPPVFEHYHLGKVDIRTLTPERAKQLVEAGVKEIVELLPAATKPRVTA